MTRPLSARQREVLRLTAAGYTSTQIGNRLGISGKTAASHLGEIYKVLGAQDRAHAVALAIYRGHITLAELAAIAGGSTVRVAEASREAADSPQTLPSPPLQAREAREGPQAPVSRTNSPTTATAKRHPPERQRDAHPAESKESAA
ncbi:response regulator transcription factor [Streptomyces mirabilis]|uniref:response regulator transcription factor n=1 Tax=Streptomyces mirabilis TaxID=68239 RepID=UPI0036CE2113